MRISITKRAERNYYSIKSHIIIEWGENAGKVFEQKDY